MDQFGKVTGLLGLYPKYAEEQSTWKNGKYVRRQCQRKLYLFYIQDRKQHE